MNAERKSKRAKEWLEADELKAPQCHKNPIKGN